jgi:hypothetical protein
MMIFLTLSLALAALPAQEANPIVWRAAASMGTARTGHCAIGISEGKVLIAGGADAEGSLASTEIYGPGDRFSPAAPMKAARSEHTCTLLPDGRVLAAGGSDESSAEVWNPETNQWSEASGDRFLRRGHTATLLRDGRVLLAGGAAGDTPTTTLALYDPAANEIRVLGATLIDPREGHIAALLSDGRVLLAAGRGLLGALNTSEFFDPQTESEAPGPVMGLRRAYAGATILPDNRVLVAAGTDFTDELGNGELYLESENRWDWIPAPMAMPRRRPLVLLLPSGQALIAGGEIAGRPVSDTETFDPSTSLFLTVGALTAPRSAMAGAVIPGSHQVLATGGAGTDGPSPLCGVLFTPSLSFANRDAPNTSDFDVSESVRIRGIAWQDTQAVRFSLTADGVSINNRLTVTSAVPSNGSFSVSVFTATSSDVGKSFVLTATQGNTAVTTATISFRVRVRSTLGFRFQPTSAVAGTPITFTYILGSTSNVGPMNGTLTFTVGPLTRTLTVLSQAPGEERQHTICCINTPGSYQTSMSYAGDSRYQPVLIGIISPQVSVTALTLQPSSTLNHLTLLEEATIPITFGIPPTVTPAVPAPTGTLTVRGATIPDTVLTLTPSPRGNTSSTSFRFRPTLETRTNAAFLMRYSGDANHPPLETGMIFPVFPARTTIAATGASSFGVGELYSIPVSIKFPSELGILTRSVRVDLIRNTVTLDQLNFPLINVGVGEASSNLLFPVPFDTRNIIVTYPGGGDLATSSVTIPVQRRLIPTQSFMRLMASPTLQPLTLQATINGCPPAADCSTLPAPSGTVRFFDGDLLLGETPARSASAGQSSASLGNVVRPPGTRQFRVQYAGDSVYAGSTSNSLPVTVQ